MNKLSGGKRHMEGGIPDRGKGTARRDAHCRNVVEQGRRYAPRHGRLLIPVLFLLLLLTACQNDDAGPKVGFAPDNFRADDWTGKKIAVITGSIYDKTISDYIPGAQPAYFNNAVDEIEALKSGRIDAFMQNDVSIRKYASKTPGLRLLEPFVTQPYL